MDKKKKFWQRAAALITAAAMTACIFTGCGKNEEKPETPQAKGRYVEREIAMPETAGKPVGIIYDDGLVLYTHTAKEDGYESYVCRDGGWSEPREEQWMNEGLSLLRCNAIAVFLGCDGNVYAKTEPATEEDTPGAHIITAAEDGTVKDVTPESDSEKALGFTNLTVLKDGTIGIGNCRNSMAEFYRDGKLIFSAEGIPSSTEDQIIVEADDDTVAVIRHEKGTIDFYDAESFEKKNTIETGQDLDSSILLLGGDGIWYLVNRKGIHRMTEEGSITETIMDGGNGMMSNDTAWYLRKFIAGNEEQFYGLYSNAKQEWKLMYYAFDETAAAVQEKTLSVYSLKENPTVNQAVYEFQNKHPEVRVDYRTAVNGDEQPTADHIRTLNTELLGGSGADVLILDGLPMESYMEKGVLADISDVAEKLEQAGAIKNIIENTANKDGKIYAVPARINVPVIFGTDDEENACRNLTALIDYAKNHSDRKLFGATAHELIGMTLFHMFYDELLEEDGGLNEEKLAELLSTWMQICENGNFKEIEEQYFDYEETDIWNALDKSFCSAQEVIGQKIYVNVTELSGVNASNSAYTSAGKLGTSPQSFKEYYVPKTIAGVNASSGQQDLAKQFVECLFSEPVQQTDTWDGFPVLNSVLDTYPEYVETQMEKQYMFGYGGIDFETGESFQEVLKYPTKEEMEALIEMMRTLKTPFIQDRMIADVVREELEKCYDGKQLPEDTAKAICKKVDTYFAE